MNYQTMSEEELSSHYCGAAMTIAAVLTILASAAIAVVLYRVFLSSKGSASIGGWKFTWS